MNWFIYIGGFFLTVPLVFVFFNQFTSTMSDGQKNFAVSTIFIAWLLSWIWICWRFIK